MTVGKLMTSPVKTVTPDTSAFEVAQAFKTYQVRVIPVVEEGRPVGAISEKEFIRLFLPGYVRFMDIYLILERPGNLDILISRTQSKKACNFMHREFFTVSEEKSFRHVMAMLFEKKAEYLLVTREENLVGVITLQDLIRYLANEMYLFTQDKLEESGEKNAYSNAELGVPPS